VLPDADFDVVKAAYKQLMKKYHPDRPRTGNAEKAKEINAAFEAIKRQRTHCD